MRKYALILFMVACGASAAVSAEAASLRITPGSGTFTLGGTFDVNVMINTGGIPVNTIEVELDFPADKLQIANPSLGKSIVQIWASPPVFSNRDGRIYFVGGITSPGINTSEGIVQSFTFRVVSPGEAKISFGESTSVLANDGLGTDVLKQTSPALFRLILPPAQGPDVFSPTHPEQGKWYRDPNPILKWTGTNQSQGFSYSIDHDPNTAPDTTVDTFDAEATLSNLESGIWYFHVRERAGGSWGGVSHYFLNIDTLPPAAFKVAVSPGERTPARPAPILRFFTTDSLSGFDHFEIKTVPLKSGPNESTFFFEAGSPYQLTGLESGRNEVIVRAYDKAGNFLDESVTLQVVASAFTFITSEGIDFLYFFLPWGALIPVLGVLAFLALLYVLRMWQKHRRHLRHAFREDFKRLRPRANTNKRTV